MGKIMKIFEDETNIYSGNCYVNSMISRGRIYGEFHGIGQGGIKFALQLSNGKDGSRVCATSGRNNKLDEQEKAQRIANGSEQSDNAFNRVKTGTWRKLTFADCTALGEVAKRILKKYKPKNEIWIIAKYYSKQHDVKYYKGFIIRDIISERELNGVNEKIVIIIKNPEIIRHLLSMIGRFKKVKQCKEILKGFGFQKNCGC